MTRTITYRLADINDIPELVEMRIRFALELSGKQTEQSIANIRKGLISYFEKATKEQSCISYLAFSGDELVGIGSGLLHLKPGNFKNPGGKWCYVMNMYTAPDFRKRGICKCILNLITDKAVELGYMTFELHATAAGAPVYEKSGFHVHPEPTYRKFIQIEVN